MVIWIYYKKIGSPRFIPWSEVVAIFGYLDLHTFSKFHHNERTVGLTLKSKKSVRFNAFNYNFKGKFFEFDEAFITCPFRQCYFYRYGLLAHKNKVVIFKPYSQFFFWAIFLNEKARNVIKDLKKKFKWNLKCQEGEFHNAANRKTYFEPLIPRSSV